MANLILAAENMVNQDYIEIEFSPAGWRILKDERKDKNDVFCGYLMDTEDAPQTADPAACESLIKYFFDHPKTLPGVGEFVQKRYLKNYSIQDRERIGNDGEEGLYAQKSGHPLLDVMTAAEAADLWGLSRVTVVQACTGHQGRAPRLQKNECRKSGGTWMVTRAGMRRIFGLDKEEKRESGIVK